MFPFQYVEIKYEATHAQEVFLMNIRISYIFIEISLTFISMPISQYKAFTVLLHGTGIKI